MADTDFVNIAKILALVDGIIAIIQGLLGLFKVGFLGFMGLHIFAGITILGPLLIIIAGLFMVNVYLARVEIPLEGLVLGIVVLIVGILFTTWLGIIAGILLIYNEYA